MRVVRTVKVPVHYRIPKHKLTILNSLTARTTYGVWTWSELFRKHGLKGTYTDRRHFHTDVREQARLGGAMTQCCFDTASWMWASYRELRIAWRRNVATARRGDKKRLRKLLQREPQEPLVNGMRRKVPIWFDQRIGSIEPSKHVKICPYVARISTLIRGVKLVIPLNPAKYHLDVLRQGTIKSFQIIKRHGNYHFHIKVEYEVPDQTVHAVRGIDLGVKRSVASVMLRPDQPLRSSDFSTLTDGLKRDRLNRLEKRTTELKRQKKWEPLKRLRHKHRNVAVYYDRLTAKQIAATSQNCLVVVGYPKGIKYTHPRGNGKPRQRKTLAHWTYGRQIRYIQEECTKLGIPADAPDEFWSSRRCHRCGSHNTERLTQSTIHCWNCELIYNADFNAGINIGSPFLPTATARRATDDLAHAGDERAREIVAREPRSPHQFMGG